MSSQEVVGIHTYTHGWYDDAAEGRKLLPQVSKVCGLILLDPESLTLWSFTCSANVCLLSSGALVSSHLPKSMVVGVWASLMGQRCVYICT